MTIRAKVSAESEESTVPTFVPEAIRYGCGRRRAERFGLFEVERMAWMRQHRKVPLDISRGPRFDRSFMAVSAAVDGLGVCLESLLLAQRELETGRLVAPLGGAGPKIQAYSFNLLRSRAELLKIRSFQNWLFEELDGHSPAHWNA